MVLSRPNELQDKQIGDLWRQILSLKWNQVDLNGRTVRLDVGTTKNDKGRLIVLDGELLETMGKAQGGGDTRTIAYLALPLRIPSRRETD